MPHCRHVRTNTIVASKTKGTDEPVALLLRLSWRLFLLRTAEVARVAGETSWRRRLCERTSTPTTRSNRGCLSLIFLQISIFVICHFLSSPHYTPFTSRKKPMRRLGSMTLHNNVRHRRAKAIQSCSSTHCRKE
jgi:hypothetical protein